MDLQYQSIKSIVDTYVLKTGNEDITESQILRLTNDALETFLPADQYKVFISILDVVNYKAVLPNNFKYVVQAAYNLNESISTREVITQYQQKKYGTDCKYELNLICDDCGPSITEVEITADYIKNNGHIFYKHSNLYQEFRSLNNGNSYVDDRFHLMRRTTNYFFNIPYHLNDCINFHVDSKIEYNIEDGSIITNFQEGQILLAYAGYRVDKDGWLMIPDHPAVYDALIKSIEEPLAYIEYRKDKNPTNRNFYMEAMQMKEKAVLKAKTQMVLPSRDKWKMFMTNHWNRQVPNRSYESNHNAFVGDSNRNALIGDY